MTCLASIILAVVNLHTVRDVSYLEGEELAEASASRVASCRLDIRCPEGQKGFPTLVWFHGGGLTKGNKHFYTTEETGQRMAEVTCQYRLLGENGVTNGADCVEDAAAAVAWTIRHIHEYGGNPRRVFVAGSSAGGYLTMMVAMDPKWLAKYGLKPSDIAGIAPNSGQATTHFAVRKFRGDTRPSAYPVLDDMAPLYHAQNWRDMPRRILSITGEPPWEWKCRAEENELLIATLKALGHPHAQYVRLPFADHVRTFDWGREYIVRFVLGEFPEDLVVRKEKCAEPVYFFSNGTVGVREVPQREIPAGAQTKLVDFGADAFGWLEVRGEGLVRVAMGEKLAEGGYIDRHPGGSVRFVASEVQCPSADWWIRVPLPADERNTTGRNGLAHAISLPTDVGVILPFRYVEVPLDVVLRRVTVSWPMKQKIVWRAKGVADITEAQEKALEELFDFCAYSIRATSFAGVYVDGDRERIPYEGDIYINMLGQLYGVDGDPTLARKSIRHVLKYPTWPTEWKQHAIMCVWEEWNYTGETNLAAECYDMLKRDKLMLDRARGDGLLPSDPRADLVDWPRGERDGYDMETPANTLINAFHYRNLVQMRDLARALGKADDEMFFLRRSEQVRARFNEVFFNAEAGLYVDGEGASHSSLHANAMAIYAGLADDRRIPKVADFIARKGMSCSPYFAQYYLEALFKGGRRADAIRLLCDRGPRSWLGMKDQGSTITMEAWSNSVKPNQDWNHAWGAAPANLLPRYLSSK